MTPKKWSRGSSDIHGNGAFASKNLHPGEVIGPVIDGLKGGGLLGGNRTKLGELLNHQSKPNSVMKPVPGMAGKYFLMAGSDIGNGSEITMDYNDTPWFIAKPKDLDPKGYKDWK